MKIHYLFFGIFLSCFCTAQMSRQQAEAERMKMEVTVYSELIMESQQVDLKKINEIVLKSINKNYLTKPNLVFEIENLNPVHIIIDLQPIEYIPSRMRNPYFNQVTFWNKKNISFLVKKLKKNLIPYRIDGYNYGYLSPDNKKIIQLLDESYIKHHIFEQKEGKIITVKGNKTSEDKILYFSYDSQPLVLKENGDLTNFDKIRIDFSNRSEKIIEFTITYNFNEHSERFVYQYINNRWKPISE